jgi:glucosamine kinase
MRDGAAYVQSGLDGLGFRAGDRLCLTGGIGARYAPFLDADYARNLAAPRGSALEGAVRLAHGLAEGKP